MLKYAGITAEYKVLALNGINPVLCFLGAHPRSLFIRYN